MGREEAALVYSQKALVDVLLNEDRVAIYYGVEAFLSMDIRCEVFTAWKSHTPDQMGFAFPKQSPFFESFKYQLLKLYEAGLLKV